MPDLTGDVFESTFSNEQNRTTNEDLLKELRSQTRILEQINASIEGILNSNQGNRYQYEDNIRQFYDSNGRNNTTRERQGAKATRNKNNRSFSDSIDKDADSIKETLHKLSKALGDSVDSFEKGLRSSLFSEPEISKIFNQHMVNLADSLGVELDELPQKFGEQITKMFQNYVNIAGANGNRFARTLGDMIDQYNAAQGALNERMSNLVQKGISKLFPGIDTGSYSDITGQIFSKNQKSKTDEQSESDTDKNSAFNKIFDRSEKDYLNNIQALYIDQVDATVRQVILSDIDLQNLLEDKIEVNSETELKYPAVVENVLNKSEDKPLNKNLSSSGYSYSRTEQSLYIEKAIATAEQVVFTDSDSLKELLKNAKNNGSNAPNPADYVKEEPKNNDTGADITGFADKTAKAISGATGSILSGIATMGIGLAVEAVTTSLAADFKELKSELSALVGQVSKVAKRYDDETRQIISNSTKRLMDDVEVIVREPFEILEDAANKVYEVWDNELRLINATQGYTKSDMQDLMSNYAARITEAGLSSVVSATDMTENLAKVLESGLSGAAAEEFAYIATILDAAIPTQEFFDYVDTYVSLAGNMIAQGYSESEALEYANEQLELFASNTLYASRELAGGFTTGLQHASDIFTQSAQIAQTANSSNVAEISSVLTAVAAVTGSIAPDLATTMTDLIYQAATGGNSSELVALRSLAGINASNTEFLNALVNDPQSVFVTMFKNLDKLINTSNDNYMEVAESLSEVFGISTDALRRIDFNYLANAIDNMNISDASLSENLALLASGETTTSAEQLRMQQINEYMLEEGLAYVVDNETARYIQQHMWEEQIANDLMDATYGVEMIGDTKELMTSIKETVLNIATLGIRKVVSAFSNRRQNRQEANAEIEDLETILEAGKVGEGNAQDLYNLTTRGVKLDLTDDLVTLLTGQQSAYSQTTRLGNTGTWARIFGTGSKYSTADVVSSESDAKNAGYHSISSMYSWSTNVSKSNATQAGMLSGGAASGTSVTRSSATQSSTAETESRVESKIEQMLSEEYIRDIIENGGGYTDWEESAKKFGITDISSTLEDLGYVESEIESYFQTIAATMSAEESNRFYEREEEFWDNVEMWLEQIYTFMDESIYQDALIDRIYQEALTDNIYQDALVDKVYQEALLDKIYQDALTDGIYQHALMDSIYSDVLTSKIYENSFKKDGMYKELKAFYDGWYDYIYQHNAYNESYDYSNVASIQAKEKTGSQDAVYALAEELTKNTTNLLDPTMQTNALLAQILIVVNAIMQNENASTSATSLSDTLSGLALGLFNTSTT